MLVLFLIRAARRSLLLLASSAVCSALLLPYSAAAQALTDRELEEAGGITASGTTNDAGPLGIIPVQKGLNASLATSSQHDSSNGWSSVVTPDVAYRFGRHVSIDAAVPIYAYINIDANIGTKAKPVYAYAPKKGVPGDTSLMFHYEANPFEFGYNGTVSLGLPSGNTNYGLGAGQPTFNFNNHIERSFGIVTPDLEVGYGDASGLVNSRVKKSYTSVGPLAHFQAGASVELPRGMDFEADIYEDLPLSSDLIYSTTRKGKKKVTTSSNVGPAEDNGFLTTLDMPLAAHVTMSGFYNRSLRDHDDTAGFSLTFLMRAPPRVWSMLN
jgi:hypothetical protein